jgi:hypothetical protein
MFKALKNYHAIAKRRFISAYAYPFSPLSHLKVLYGFATPPHPKALVGNDLLFDRYYNFAFAHSCK